MFTSSAPGATSLTAGSISLAAIASSASSHHHSHDHSHSHSTAAPPSSTSRTRRGLSYLRNYTQNHLTRDRNSQNSATSPVSPTSTAFWPPDSLTRSHSDNPSSSRHTTETHASTAAADLDQPVHSRRFTLVPTYSHPLDPSSTRPVSDDEQQHHRSTNRRANQSSVTALERDDNSRVSRSMTRSRSATTGTVMAPSSTLPRSGEDSNLSVLPSIRFSVFVDPRSQRPSLHFSPISRTLSNGTEVIRVGRYSERDSQPTIPANVPSSAPVGFKSKVVSRRHCEFWYEEGKWYIKDVKSSSGTFLNHIRLSPPGQESKPFPVNDGDVVQLGIDFKGGEEMIFRCVKMRLELNRGWQTKLNKFNMNSHKRLWNMTKSDGQNGQNYSQDCSICLNSIAPCQCLFVAPCSHTWHFKCIRALLQGPQYPIFQCPNCRAAADLEAEVEDPEDWEELNEELADKDNEHADDVRSKEPRLDPPAKVETGRASSDRIRSSLERARASAAERTRASLERSRPTAAPRTPAHEEEPAIPSGSSSSVSVVMEDVIPLNDGATTPPSTVPVSRGASEPVPIPNAATRRTPSPGTGGVSTTNGHEGPITPRNDAGPWVFDGSGARIGAAPTSVIARQSLNGVADMDVAVEAIN